MKMKKRKVSNKRLEKIISNCCYFTNRYGDWYQIHDVEKDGFNSIYLDTWTKVKVLFKDINLAHDKFYTMKNADLEIQII